MTDGFADTGSQRSSRSPRTITVDNLLRKTLRVADPHDPEQMANVLLARYPEEAERNRREIAGFNFASGPAASTVAIDPGPSGYELESARDDLERDIHTLTTFSQLKEIQVELKGWGRAVRSAAAQGLAAARLALDSNQNDIALASRRTLYQYARLARYVGAVSDGSAVYFRRFAQSCDVLAALILVGIGDGLAARGITRSTTLVRVAASELQMRRNAVISALRTLTGSLDSPLGQSEYPRGIVGYQMLLRQLDGSGQADLRSLLEENALSAAMDQLVDLTGGSSIDSLRELSTTSAILLERFERLIQHGSTTPVNGDGAVGGSPEAPPLLAFVAALQFFVDAFSRTGGARLLQVARPPILAYGLYGSADQTVTFRLMRLTLARAQLVNAIDCLAACACDPRENAVAVLLDFVLSIVDRAVDLWAVGTDPAGLGDPERRAATAGILAFAVESALSGEFLERKLLDDPPENVLAALSDVRTETGQNLIDSDLDGSFVTADDLVDPPGQATRSSVLNELRIAYASERQIERLVRTLGSGCSDSWIFDWEFTNEAKFRGSLVQVMLRAAAHAIDPAFDIDPPRVIELPHTYEETNDTAVTGRALRNHVNGNFAG